MHSYNLIVSIISYGWITDVYTRIPWFYDDYQTFCTLIYPLSISVQNFKCKDQEVFQNVVKVHKYVKTICVF